MKFTIKELFLRIASFSIFSLMLFSFNPQSVKAEFSNLVPCKDSPAFQKRLTTEVKKLENRLKFYTPESKESNFLIQEIEHTKLTSINKGRETSLFQSFLMFVHMCIFSIFLSHFTFPHIK